MFEAFQVRIANIQARAGLGLELDRHRRIESFNLKFKLNDVI